MSASHETPADGDLASGPLVHFDDPLRLAESIAALGRPLLVGTDIDGTLSPIVATPAEARVLPGTAATLIALADHDDVEVAVVSGRSLAELLGQFQLPSSLHVVGSHGAEGEHVAPLDVDEVERLRLVAEALEQVREATPGATIEHKPFAAALHVRNAVADVGDRALIDGREAVATLPGVVVHDGHRVVEVAVRAVNKAGAVAQLRSSVGAAAVVFVGDDSSDETVFATLGADDLGIRVGPGTTAAGFRLRGPTDVLTMFQQLVELL